MNAAIVILLTAILITLLGAWGNVRWVALGICVLAILIWCGILVFKGIGFLKDEAEDSPVINYLRKRKAIAKLNHQIKLKKIWVMKPASLNKLVKISKTIKRHNKVLQLAHFVRWTVCKPQLCGFAAQK